jgi:hypothetical protein
MLRLLLIFAVPSLLPTAAEPSWPRDTPEHYGMSRGALDAWRNRLAEHKTRALLVIRHDKIIYEWYAEGQGPEKK